VQKGSPADQAGIKVGDVFVSLDGQALTEKEAFNRLMAEKRWGDTVTFVVKRGSDTVTIKVPLRRTVEEAK